MPASSAPNYKLKRLYARLRAAAQRGDLPTIKQLLVEVLGSAPLMAGTTRPSADAPLQSASWVAALVGPAMPLIPATGDDTPAVPDTTMLRYRGFKRAEIAMLLCGIKPVVKFEDIPTAAASAFVARYGDRFVLSVSAPYRKDYLLLRSSPTVATDKSALVTIYAALDDRGLELAALERSDPTNVAAAGQLLSIPTCCTQAFAADAQRARVDEETVNDDATARLLRSVADGTGHPALDPLSDLELLGFYPCSLRCDAAIARASEVLAAIDSLWPAHGQLCRRALGTPALFFRLPFFARKIDAQWRANVFTQRDVAPVQSVFAAAITHASEVERSPLRPAVVRFAAWPVRFF